MVITTNPDKEYAHELKKLIRANGGYCLSKPTKSKETKCICKEFYDAGEGMCSCGLYIKEEE